MSNILKVKFGKETQVYASPLYQYDYGQKARIFGLDLPAHYEVHFSNYERGDATTVLASSNEFDIPDMYLQSGRDVYIWIYLHAGNNDGETEYQITIPVIKRAKPTDEAPTPEEQSVITETIAALNDAVTESREGVERVQQIENNVNNVYNLVEADKDIIYQYKEDAKSYAEDAADKADRAEQAATHAESVETSVFAARDEAVTASNNAAESENFARSYAEQTARDKSVAENAADNAAQSAQEAARSAASIEGDVEESEVAARQAEAAKNASETARVAAEAAKDGAEAAATNAGNSAGAAAQSAQDAETAKTAAAGSASDAVTSASSATISAQQAASSASTASAAASTATTKANDAAAAASAAGDSATSASAASSAAISAKDDAVAAKTAAQAAATSATNSASSASSSATTANSAATTATAAQTAAEVARDRAETAAESVEESAAQIEQNRLDIAEQKSAIEDLTALTNRKAGMLVDTASGSIASFVPDATIPDLLGVSVAVEPVQDLHGYDNPWPAGGGVNLLPFENEFTEGWTTTVSDLTVKYSNGHITVKGTNNSGSYVFAVDKRNIWSRGTYTSGAGQYTPSNHMSVVCYVDGTANNVSSTVTASTSIEPTGFFIAVNSGQTVDWDIPLMFVRGSERPSTFSPYSNICPISGWDGVEVERTGTNLFDINGETTFIYDGVSIQNNKIVISSIGNGATSRVYFARTYKPGTYTFSAKMSGQLEYVRIFSPQPFAGGTYNSYYGGYFAALTNGQRTVTMAEPFTIGIIGYGTTGGQAEIYDIQLEPGNTATDYKPFAGNVYEIQIGQTVYGGTLAIAEDGSVTALVDRAMVDLGTLTWQKTDNHFYTNDLRSVIKAPADNYTKANVLCSQYETAALSVVYSETKDCAIAVQTTPASSFGTIHINDTSFASATASEFKTAMSGVQFCYELATPITIPLDPVTIAAIAGQTNNVWADAGDVTVEFAADLKHYIDSKIAAAVAALS